MRMRADRGVFRRLAGLPARRLILVVVPWATAQIALGGDAAATADDTEALRLGRQVLAVQAALADPDAPGAMQTILTVGNDTRYHVMIRGWLAQQRRADQAILDASGNAAPEAIRRRVKFLDRAIRAIDLE